MVEVGLVPDNVAEEARYPQVVDEERTVANEAEKAAEAGGGSSGFGSASDGWRSRVPSEFEVGMTNGDLHPEAGNAGGKGTPRSRDTIPLVDGACGGSGTGEQKQRVSAAGRGAGANGRGHPSGEGGRPVEDMDVEEDERDRACGVERELDGGGGCDGGGAGSGPINARTAATSTGNHDGTSAGCSKPGEGEGRVALSDERSPCQR